VSLKDCETVELRDRYLFLMEKYVKIAQELAPLLDKFGKYREELQVLTVEFVERGFSVDDPESLVKIIQQEIAKKEDEQTPDKT